MPERIQRKRVKGWRLPEGAKIVDRSSRWGNPFAVRKADGYMVARYEVYLHRPLGGFDRGLVIGILPTREEAHTDAVRHYRDWFPSSGLAEQLDLLRGHDLACPCPADLPCHADFLLIEANR